MFFMLDSNCLPGFLRPHGQLSRCIRRCIAAASLVPQVPLTLRAHPLESL
jgi:hypothetical protein